MAYDDVTPGLMDHAAQNGKLALLSLRDAANIPLDQPCRREFEDRARYWARRAASFAIRALDRRASRLP